MHGRRLATTDRLIAVVSPGSEAAFDRLGAWADERGLECASVTVGQDVSDVYDETRATLGVTFGGDGTFLEGIKTFAPRGIPLLGVNTGTLGFLARVEPDDLEAALEETLQGRATVDSRQQIRVDARDVGATGINDVTIEHVPPENPTDRKIARLDVFADDEYVGELEGTGLAISTPTGSTGISLSANGPIHYPVDNHTLQLVPLHTHQLGVRPIVMAPTTVLRIVTRGRANLLVDGGRAHTILRGGDEVRVTGADRLAHLVRTSYDDHFFAAITKKLGWDVREDDDDGPRDRLSDRSLIAVDTVGDSITTAGDDVVDRALRIAIEAAESAGEPLRELHGNVESVTVKTDEADVVTEADHQADRIITTVIGNEFPDHDVFSEESVRQTGGSPYTWAIDPLDGSGNFAHGNPNYAVSIAMIENGQPIVGVVHVPETGETFSAVAGQSAHLNGSPIATTGRDSLDESMLLSGYDPDGSFLSHFYQEARGVRRLGCAALSLCFLASGSADATWEYDTYPWDVAAGICIAREAGARITDGSGEPYAFDFDTEERKELLGTNGPLHDALLEYLEAGVIDLE